MAVFDGIALLPSGMAGSLPLGTWFTRLGQKGLLFQLISAALCVWTIFGILIGFLLCLTTVVYVGGFPVASCLSLVSFSLFVSLARQGCFFLLSEMCGWFCTRGTWGDGFILGQGEMCGFTVLFMP